MNLFKSVALVLLALTGLAQANDNRVWRESTLNKALARGELRVGMELGFAPFEMRNDKGEIVGFDVDIARAMAEAMGVKLRLVPIDWNGIVPGLLTDQYDIVISGMTITPERNLWVNFSDPYMVVGQTALVRRGLKKRIKSYRDLNMAKYRVATKPGVTSHQAVKKLLPAARVVLFETEAEGVRAVLRGEADAFIYDLPYNSVQHRRHKGALGFLDKPFTHERLGWAVRKGDPDFLNWLNNFLAQIEGDGTYERIRRKWFVNDDWMDTVRELGEPETKPQVKR